MSVRAVVLRTAGTNCDQETLHALRLAGAHADAVHINQFISGKRKLEDFQILVIAGGFSYGDDIAAGKILANELRSTLGTDLAAFIARGKIVIGICNGFQVLVKTGFLPGDDKNAKQTFTLANNDSGRFQCHWTSMERETSACDWLNKTDADWELPIAHGEGKFWPQDAKTLAALEKNKQVVFRYKANPNGSANRIAGVCNAQGNVIGLMPHPERHVVRTQHPEWTRREKSHADPVGLQFFKAAVNFAERLS